MNNFKKPKSELRQEYIYQFKRLDYGKFLVFWKIIVYKVMSEIKLCQEILIANKRHNKIQSLKTYSTAC